MEAAPSILNVAPITNVPLPEPVAESIPSINPGSQLVNEPASNTRPEGLLLPEERIRLQAQQTLEQAQAQLAQIGAASDIPRITENSLVSVEPVLDRCPGIKSILLYVTKGLYNQRSFGLDFDDAFYVEEMLNSSYGRINNDAIGCLPQKNSQGMDLVYWIVRTGREWSLVPALRHRATELKMDEGVRLLGVQNMYDSGAASSPLALLRQLSLRSAGVFPNPVPGAVQAGMSTWGDSSTLMPDISVLLNPSVKRVSLRGGDVADSSPENEHRIRLQEELLMKRKPPLVRILPGAKFNGLGVRDPELGEFKREWAWVRPGTYVAVRVDVTRPNGDIMTSVVLKARALSRHPKSRLLNGLGTVFALDVRDIVGDPDDVYAFTPIRVGRRKVRYWLCVYDDLEENKVVASSALVEHDELADNLMGPRGDGRLRLAEYAVGDIRLTDSNGNVIPFPGDVDDSQPMDTTTSKYNSKERLLLLPTEVGVASKPKPKPKTAYKEEEEEAEVVLEKPDHIPVVEEEEEEQKPTRAVVRKRRGRRVVEQEKEALDDEKIMDQDFRQHVLNIPFKKAILAHLKPKGKVPMTF